MMSFQRAEQLLLSLSNIPRDEYMDDRTRLPGYLIRIRELLKMLGNPEKKIPHYIHVTGTSGKGSVSSYLHSILSASGKKTGLYISPHPTHILERWQVGNNIMTEKEFAGYMETLWPILETYLQKNTHDIPSFFDLCTIIAFMHFAKKKCAWAIIEVGCGGRYDSTNVLPWKDVAVITNIGYDHTTILGKTKTKIAYEKAGIIKPGCRVFTMERSEKIRKVIEKECMKNKIELITGNWKLETVATNTTGTTFKYNNSDFHIKALGEHQAANSALCIDIAKHLNISDTAIYKGLARAVQPLRMEVVSKQPLIILDGAHNEDKIRSTVSTIQQLRGKKQLVRSPFEGELRPQPVRGSVHLIVGFSNDKDIANLVEILATLRPATVACTRNTSNPFRKAAHPRHLATLFKKYSPTSQTKIFLDSQSAFAWSKKQTKKHDILLVTGSIFLSGELRLQDPD